MLGFTLVEICQAQAEPKLTVQKLLEIESCKAYVKTPLQTLDGIYVNQPKRFLPLTKEAKKLAEEFKKEKIASQWAGIPPEKLLQGSFVEQLNSPQSLDQLASLTAAKEHLPKDIINILELLGKADNILFNQLYNLGEDCVDRYYTKVIKTLTHLLKSSFHDRQLVLVNSARALKFLESYAARQAKLWKWLSKYNQLPDHYNDLKTTLQTEFNLLKKATSKNIENLQEAIMLQQTYTTTLCSHVNSIYFKLAQLERQVQMHCLYPQPQSNEVQLNAPEYNLDIDGQTDQVRTPSAAQQSLNAKNIQEDITSDATNSEQHTASFPDTDRPESQPLPVSDDTDYPRYQDTEQSRAEHPSDYRPQLEDIPELEDNEENWEEGQFADADFIDHHNTTEESDRICHEYSAHLEKVTDQGYSTYNCTTPGSE